MQMHEVTTQEDVRAFLELPLTIYENDRKWIRPLDKDIEEVFDSKKNKFFKSHSSAACSKAPSSNVQGMMKQSCKR